MPSQDEPKRVQRWADAGVGHADPEADLLSLVKRWLERKEQGCWLMIIDNADDAQLWAGLLPWPLPEGVAFAS